MATHRFQLVWLNWFNMVVIFSIRLSIMYEYFSSKLVRGCVTISYLEWISAPIASARFLIIFTWSISEGKESRRERHFSKWIVAPAFTCCQTFANYLEMNRWIDIYLCTKLIDDWLISWLVVWLFDWLIDRLIDWLIDWCWQIGVSYNLSNVSIYVVDLKKVAPFGVCHNGDSGLGSLGGLGGPFRHGQSLRKSFNKEKPIGNRQTDIKVNEESDDKSSTETEDDAISTADIKDLNNYHTIFQPRGRECKFLNFLHFPIEFCFSKNICK